VSFGTAFFSRRGVQQIGHRQRQVAYLTRGVARQEPARDHGARRPDVSVDVDRFLGLGHSHAHVPVVEQDAPGADREIGNHRVVCQVEYAVESYVADLYGQSRPSVGDHQSQTLVSRGSDRGERENVQPSSSAVAVSVVLARQRSVVLAAI